jgi:serine/threonine protein kinase
VKVNLKALKIVQKKSKKKFGMKDVDTELDKIRKEIAIMKKCSHPNIVRLFEVIDDPNQEKIYLVLEHVDGGELRWKDECDEPIWLIEQVKSYFRDTVIGLDYCTSLILILT